MSSAARSVEGRPKHRYVSGGKVVREVDLTDEQYADHLDTSPVRSRGHPSRG